MATQESTEIILDPETQFLIEMRIKSNANPPQEDQEEDGYEWDKFKENVKPLKRGRNVKFLNDALKSHYSHIPLKQSLLLTRRKLIEAIDEYSGDDPLQPWLQCIKWVQEAFPAAGDSSGLLLIYEQCVRTFWHDDQYKDDLRYLKVWLEYAENCADAEVIYRFLDANKIGQTHSAYYISYALHLESKHKIKTANEVFNRGLLINAQPLQKMEAAYRKFLARSMGRSQTNSVTAEGATEDNQQVRSFGTVLSRDENRSHQVNISGIPKKNFKGNRGERIPMSFYKDNDVENVSAHPQDLPWDSLGTHRDRNKENKAIPGKWTSYKVPQRPNTRLAVPVTPAIAVFVDEDNSDLHQTRDDCQKSSILQLKERDDHELKRETDLLKENPLRNFPIHSFPR